jgi:hypothetical protein
VIMLKKNDLSMDTFAAPAASNVGSKPALLMEFALDKRSILLSLSESRPPLNSCFSDFLCAPLMDLSLATAASAWLAPNLQMCLHYNLINVLRVSLCGEEISIHSTGRKRSYFLSNLVRGAPTCQGI